MALGFLKKMSRPVHFFIACLTFFLVALIDYATGWEIAFSFFYLIPVLFCGWLFGLGGGISAAIVAAFIWFGADKFSGHHYSYTAISYWNATVRLLFFLTFSVIFNRLQKEIEKQKLSNEQLTQKSLQIIRLAHIKSEFTSMVSHELRSPLTAMKENLAIVYDGSAGPLTIEQKDFLESVKRSIDRLSRLIHDILDFQRLEMGHMSFHFEAEDLNPLVQEVASNFSPLMAQKGLKLKLDLEPKLAFTEVDHDRINQVLTNLLQNAIRYSDNGTITIRTRFLDGEIQLSVEDEGRGISKEEMPKLFQSFERLSSSEGTGMEGTGLGLAISRRIIEVHNGRIEVDSVEGKGSVFRVVLKSVSI